MNTENYSQTASFIWSVADLLRGHFKQSQYGRVILPFTLLRRLECVLAPNKQKVLEAAKQHQNKPDAVREQLLLRESQNDFYNASSLTLATLSDTQTAEDLISYVQSFSSSAREIFEHFNFEEFVLKLAEADLLYQITQQFGSKIDLSTDNISNYGMGLIFEELIRKFAESSNETAGEHFTPRDCVHAATSLLMTGQEEVLSPNSIITIYDPTAGTGGFLSESEEYIQSISEKVTVKLFGQELNSESYAICKADMMIKSQEVDNIKLGNTLSNDQLAHEKFKYMLANPPFGVDWKASQRVVNDEHKVKGFDGRFGPGLPRVSDGSLLFLLHLVSKMRDTRNGGSRIGIILNGSPLFTGSAGSGESEIRRYLLQNDLVEAIVALPSDMFFNTGISTYIWILSNAKKPERKGKLQLIDGSDAFAKMRKSLGSKRKYLTEENINELVRLYGAVEETKNSKVFPNEAFGYRRVTIERPLRLNFQASEERVARLDDEKALQKLKAEDFSQLKQAIQQIDADTLFINRDDFTRTLNAQLKVSDLNLTAAQLKAVLNALSERDSDADVCADKKGNPEADSGLRDYENVPLTDDIYEYFERDVKPHVPDAWIDESKRDEQDGEIGIVGFEIPFNRHFYVFEPPRPLEEIDADLKQCTDKIKQMIEELSA
ncbi:type I restriction-modification system subunit M [Idiomarina loihiensis]|uniref:site-specific DNA-methyltransferase (adenine-specific) n=1 Tax=Idiomarina loihiensis (strain ATCC BAA-735 / DSM 15497 / L2-TR) TaxID=283942 RepID=Q5QX29_IDILO|nr:class I SAM-dependent DNA methyltransferase [Idiomarina loihiensis]AAV81483.1 Type I restriction-modification system methyltransferase subunit [Idiomarina loihiensis L2TR]AGM35510.1 Type I restriction-modification system methyltransferase subunit [Idiomarina loihiensis GSL 199]